MTPRRPPILTVQTWPIGRLQPYATNPRHLTDEAIVAVVESLSRFGWQQPIVATRDGVIVAGHTRHQAALRLEMAHVPVRVIPDEDAAAYRLVDNRSAEFTTWDLKLLPAELEAAGPGLEAFDFDALLPAATPEADPDAVPEEPPEPRAQPGELWTLGRHRLLCGDATDPAQVAALLDGATPALMVTDPPYGVSYDPTWRDPVGKLGPHRRTVQRKQSRGDDPALDWTEAYRLFPGAVAYVWAPQGPMGMTFYEQMVAAGLAARVQIVWVKQHAVISRGHYHLQHEPCWYAVRKGRTAGWCGGCKQTSVWEIANLNPLGGNKHEVKTGHSAQKPVECMARPLRNHQGDVYDPFVGSGTTIIAAEQEGRTCYALDLEPGCVDMALARWEAYTGETAVRR